MMAVVLILSCMPRVHPTKKKWWWKKLNQNKRKKRGVSQNGGVFQGRRGMRDEWRDYEGSYTSSWRAQAFFSTL